MMNLFLILFIINISKLNAQENETDFDYAVRRIFRNLAEPIDTLELNFINSTTDLFMQKLQLLGKIERFNSMLTNESPGKAPWITLNDGNKMPTFGFGGAPRSAPDLYRIEDYVVEAINAGYRLIDTAELYFTELFIGRALRKKMWDFTVRREDTFIITKVYNYHHKRELVVLSLMRSLQRLGLSYVDLYLIHFPTETYLDGTFGDTDYLETWQGMEDCKELGLTKSIGVSNFNISQIQRILDNSKIKPAVLETEVNPHVNEKNLTKYCKDNNITVICYTPLGYMPRNDKNLPPPSLDDPLLTSIGNKYNKTTVQVVLRYLLDRELIPIPMSTNPKRISQNIDVFDFHLTPKEMERIDSFNKNIRVYSLPLFKNHKYYPF